MNRKACRVGMVLGKFLPPHLGHLHLVEFGLEQCERLYVVVGSLAAEPIPGALRWTWMKELCPRAHVLHLTDENPQYPEEHPDFWAIWRRSLTAVLPEPVDVVFASEAYGHRLAVELGARFFPVDPARGAQAIAASRIRADPMGCWRYLPRIVRPWYVKRVVVVGPESSGKTTLAAQLAARLGTVMVPEYARTWLEYRHQQGQVGWSAADLGPIVAGQAASAAVLARDAERVLIADTDRLTTRVWAELSLGACPDWLRQEAAAERYDLTVLCRPDLPFEPDPVRFHPERRWGFYRRLEELLRESGRRYVEVWGSGEERGERAIAEVEELVQQSAPAPA